MRGLWSNNEVYIRENNVDIKKIYKIYYTKIKSVLMYETI